MSFFGAEKQLFGYAQVAKWTENICFDRDVNKNCTGKWSDDRRIYVYYSRFGKSDAPV